MTRQAFFISILFSLIIIPGQVFSADYSQMSTSELTRLRATIGDATSEDQEAFRMEWQKRVANPETGEQKRYQNRNRTASGAGEGNNYQYSGSKGAGECIGDKARVRTTTSTQSRDMDRLHNQDRTTQAQTQTGNGQGGSGNRQ